MHIFVTGATGVLGKAVVPSLLADGKPIPMAQAQRPHEYLPGQQEMPVVLTSVADTLHWAKNWARSRSIWPFNYGLACCGIEMIAAAHWRISRSSTRSLAPPC